MTEITVKSLGKRERGSGGWRLWGRKSVDLCFVANWYQGSREEPITDPEQKAEALSGRLDESTRELGGKLERVIRPLTLENGGGGEGSLSRIFLLYCRDWASRVLELLEPRDLEEKRILVLENGAGVLARCLAESGDVDVTALAPTETAARLAQYLNPFPSIVYRRGNPFEPGEEFDLILDSGLLLYYPPELVRAFLPRLAVFCRRKLVLSFHLSPPWYRRIMGGDRGLFGELEPPEAGGSGFSEKEISYLLEFPCRMLFDGSAPAGGEAGGRNILVKAHRSPLSHPASGSRNG